MKFYSNNIQIVINKLKTHNLKSVLLYGENKGLIQDIVKNISKNLSLDISKHEFDPSVLYQMLNSQSLFLTKEMILLDISKNSLDKKTKEIILGNNINILCFVAGELPPSSDLRKFYESEESLAVIPCYNDDAKSLRVIIKDLINADNKMIDNDALSYLCDKLSGDRNIVKNEIEKIICYVGSQSKITLNDVILCINSSLDILVDDLCYDFAVKNYQDFHEESQKLLSQNIPVIWILRALARFYTNLLIVKLNMAGGVSADISTKKLKPPIFFKFLHKFNQVLNKISIENIVDILEKITQAEIDAKNNFYSENILDKLIFSI